MAFAEHNVNAGHMSCESYPILVTAVGLFVGFLTSVFFINLMSSYDESVS